MDQIEKDPRDCSKRRANRCDLQPRPESSRIPEPADQLIPGNVMTSRRKDASPKTCDAPLPYEARLASMGRTSHTTLIVPKSF